MNTGSFNAFKDEIKQIRDYFIHINQTNKLLESESEITGSEAVILLTDEIKEHYKLFRTSKKTFEYKATIISLYGLLEKYVELWVKEYLETMSKIIIDYTLIDEIIKDKHFELSLKLITTITSRESAKYKGLTKEKIIEKLHICINSPTEYKFNTDAFVVLSGNLKHSKIIEIFKTININLNDGLVKNQELNQIIGLSADKIESSEKDIMYNKINQLVERRNEIAHGSEPIEENLLDLTELTPYIDFLERYCVAIYKTLEQGIFKIEANYEYTKIEKIVRIVSNKILAFEIEEYEIEKGESLIIKTLDNTFHKKPIESIQLNNTPYDKLNIIEKTNIAIKVKHNLKDTHTFYIKKKAKKLQ